MNGTYDAREAAEAHQALQDEKSLPATPAPSQLTTFERLALDPNIDVSKLERLMAMQERLVSEQARIEFAQAFSRVQAKMRPIAKDAENPQTRSRYATYAKLDAALRPLYTEEGFSISFNTPAPSKPEHIRVVAYVSHEGGHTREYDAELPADGKGAKGGDVMTRTHAWGAGATYAQRYMLKNIWNIAVGENDTDGNMGETITRDNIGTLEALIQEVGADKAAYLRMLKIKALEELPRASYAIAVGMLETKRRARK